MNSIVSSAGLVKTDFSPFLFIDLPPPCQKLVEKYFPQFTACQEQDAQEFLDCLLNCLHEELNCVCDDISIDLPGADGHPNRVSSITSRPPQIDFCSFTGFEHWEQKLITPKNCAMYSIIFKWHSVQHMTNTKIANFFHVPPPTPQTLLLTLSLVDHLFFLFPCPFHVQNWDSPWQQQFH